MTKQLPSQGEVHVPRRNNVYNILTWAMIWYTGKSHQRSGWLIKFK